MFLTAITLLLMISNSATLGQTKTEDYAYCLNIINITDSLAFTDNYEREHYVPVLTFFFLSCCTGNLTLSSVTWYYKKWSESHWNKVILDEYRYTNDAGHVLVFEKADIITDNGTFSCNVTDGHDSVSRVFDVVIIECDMDPTKVKVIDVPPAKLQVQVGDTISQNCKGLYGCDGAVAKDAYVFWTYVDGHGDLHNLTTGVMGHYKVQEEISKDRTKKMAVLNIQNVQAEDLENVFICTVKKADVTYGFNISLVTTDVKFEKYITPIAVSSVLLFIIFLSFFVSYTLFAPLITYHWLAVANKLPDRGNFEQDAMLTYGEEDSKSKRICEELTTTLTMKGYRIMSHVQERSVIEHMDNLDKCVTSIFTLTKEEIDYYTKNSSFFDRYLGICSETNKNVIFVLLDDIPNSTWKQISKDYKKLYAKLPQFVTVLKWPPESASGRIVKNFWYSIQCKLPPPRI